MNKNASSRYAILWGVGVFHVRHRIITVQFPRVSWKTSMTDLSRHLSSFDIYVCTVCIQMHNVVLYLCNFNIHVLILFQVVRHQLPIAANGRFQ